MIDLLKKIPQNDRIENLGASHTNPLQLKFHPGTSELLINIYSYWNF